MKKKKIAFIKFGGLSAGGTENWLQLMAVNLDRSRYEVDYYYCDSAPYKGSDYKHPDTSPDRLKYMEDNNINLIKFHVGMKDLTKPTHDWIDTDFWRIFDGSKYDLIQTAKAGPKEYPYYLLKNKIVEYITLDAGVDLSKNIVCSIHLSQWQRARWFQKGGDLKKSAIIPIPAEDPFTDQDLRNYLNISKDAIVAGFHQRAENTIYSEIPLNSFKTIFNDKFHFILMGGGDLYKKQAKNLKLNNIHFLDHTGDKVFRSKFLNTLDIFAHGRKDGETFGTVLAEAMIHGKPCLSHYSEIANAQPETMGPGGYFAYDGKEYSNILKMYFTDDEARKRIGVKAIKHAKENYSVQSAVEKLESIYSTILSNEKEYSFPKTDFCSTNWKFLVSGDPLEKTSNSYLTYIKEPIEDLFYHLVDKSNYEYLLINPNGDILERFVIHNKKFEMFKNKNSEIFNKDVYLNNWETIVRANQIENLSKITNRIIILNIEDFDLIREIIDKNILIVKGLHNCKLISDIKKSFKMEYFIIKGTSLNKWAVLFRKNNVDGEKIIKMFNSYQNNRRMLKIKDFTHKILKANPIKYIKNKF